MEQFTACPPFKLKNVISPESVDGGRREAEKSKKGSSLAAD